MNIKKLDALFADLPLGPKIATLGLAAALMIAAPLSLYLGEVRDKIAATEVELKGVEPASLVVDAMRALQRWCNWRTTPGLRT